MTWHNDPNRRKAMGDSGEDSFAAQCICPCGGHFDFIGDRRIGFPDFTCDNCGQLVDVKTSEQAERTGNLAVSSIPWDHYPEDMLLATCINGKWIAEYKRNIRPKNSRPFDPTHNSQGSHLKNTSFYLISWKCFRPWSKLECMTR